MSHSIQPISLLAKLDRLSYPYEDDHQTLKPSRGLVNARLRLGGREIVGTVSYSGYGGTGYPRIMAQKRGRQNRYTPIFEHYFDGRLEIKVGSRYVDAREALSDV
jgi:hypothetical protein